jgi:hypothetical protein
MNYWKAAYLFSLLIALVFSGCQPADDTSLPTLVRFPTLTESPVPTQTSTPQTPTPTVTPSPTITQTATASATVPTPEATRQVILTIPPALATSTATPLPEQFSFGRSAQGADLVAWRAGTGRHLIILVGGIHTGFEANTVELVNQMRDYFVSNPQRVLPEITLLFIPLLNPDGMAYGRTLRGRFNGNGVDLNRNWGCGWSEQAFFREGTVNPGAAPFSEPESTALGSLAQRLQPAAILIYHGAANGVFTGACEGEDAGSGALAAVYGVASGYPYGTEFTSYTITGAAPAWFASIGIPALDVELASSTDIELERNLRGVLALQEWFTARD